MVTAPRRTPRPSWPTVRLGVHWDPGQRQEWLVIRVRANWLQWAHGACYLGTHLVRYMSGLPIPHRLYLRLHDLAEPPLRRACEARPSPWVSPPRPTEGARQ